MPSESPLDDFRSLLDRPRPRDDAAALAAAAKTAKAGQQGAALGKAGELVEWLAGWSGRQKPIVARPTVAVFAATHGVAARGISRRSPGHEQRLVEHCAAGGSAISQFCAAADIGLKVFDLALDLPSGDITAEDALDERACAATMAFGMEAIAGGSDLVVLGQIGEGGGIAAAAILAALQGGSPAEWLEISPDRTLQQKRESVAAEALARLDAPADPLTVLGRLGGRDVAAIAGAIIAARAERIPVVLDGPVALAAAAVLHAENPEAIRHCVLSQRPAFAASSRVLKALGLPHVLDLSIGSEEGLAGAAAAQLVRSLAAMHGGMVVTEVQAD